jgi:hypothetical protein
MFFCGVIEGFYGRTWPQSTRLQLLARFPEWGLGAYVYAPKADRLLRRDWRQLYGPQQLAELAELREQCRRHGLLFGIGLTPWGLQSRYGAEDRQALQRKLRQLDTLRPDLLGILFDDMPGEFCGLGARQAVIARDALDAFSQSPRLLVCPTYYSFDPVLEQLFGRMPAGYLAELGAGLPAQADLLWTGPHVLSREYTREHMAAVTARMGRAPVLWDNYPVNDGRKSSRFLNLRPVSGRPWQLRQWSRGHLANPMNQPLLSTIALASLGCSYAERDAFDPERFRAEQVPRLVGVETAALLQRDLALFQDEGLDSLAPARRTALAREYRALETPAATEVAEWLEGAYAFDPACLTD